MNAEAYDGKTPIYPDWQMTAPGAYTIDSQFTLRPGWWPPFSEEAMAKVRAQVREEL